MNCIRFEEVRIREIRRFRAAVSLHSHTLCSRESLAFIRTAAQKVPFLEGAIRRYEPRYRARYNSELDFSRGWWTPPLSPREAWQLERSQIEDKLNLDALISLTDHDTVEAASKLRLVDPTC